MTVLNSIHWRRFVVSFRNVLVRLAWYILQYICFTYLFTLGCQRDSKIPYIRGIWVAVLGFGSFNVISAFSVREWKSISEILT